MNKKAKSSWLVWLIIIGIIAGGIYFLTQKTSENIQSICEVNGWKLTPQTTDSGQGYLCWKAENPLIVKESFTWNCKNNEEFTYYFETRDINAIGSREPEVFNYIKSNCQYSG